MFFDSSIYNSINFPHQVGPISINVAFSDAKIYKQAL